MKKTAKKTAKKTVKKELSLEEQTEKRFGEFTEWASANGISFVASANKEGFRHGLGAMGGSPQTIFNLITRLLDQLKEECNT